MATQYLDEFNVPPGYKLVPERGTLTETIAFRVSREEAVGLMALRDTFPERTWAAMFRWLLHQRATKDLVAARITSVQED